MPLTTVISTPGAILGTFDFAPNADTAEYIARLVTSMIVGASEDDAPAATSSDMTITNLELGNEVSINNNELDIGPRFLVSSQYNTMPADAIDTFVYTLDANNHTSTIAASNVSAPYYNSSIEVAFSDGASASIVTDNMAISLDTTSATYDAFKTRNYKHNRLVNGNSSYNADGYDNGIKVFFDSAFNTADSNLTFNALSRNAVTQEITAGLPYAMVDGINYSPLANGFTVSPNVNCTLEPLFGTYKLSQNVGTYNVNKYTTDPISGSKYGQQLFSLYDVENNSYSDMPITVTDAIWNVLWDPSEILSAGSNTSISISKLTTGSGYLCTHDAVTFDSTQICSNLSYMTELSNHTHKLSFVNGATTYTSSSYYNTASTRYAVTDVTELLPLSKYLTPITVTQYYSEQTYPVVSRDDNLLYRVDNVATSISDVFTYVDVCYVSSETNSSVSGVLSQADVSELIVTHTAEMLLINTLDESNVGSTGNYSALSKFIGGSNNTVAFFDPSTINITPADVVYAFSPNSLRQLAPGYIRGISITPTNVWASNFLQIVDASTGETSVPISTPLILAAGTGINIAADGSDMLRIYLAKKQLTELPSFNTPGMTLTTSPADATLNISALQTSFISNNYNDIISLKDSVNISLTVTANNSANVADNLRDIITLDWVSGSYGGAYNFQSENLLPSDVPLVDAIDTVIENVNGLSTGKVLHRLVTEYSRTINVPLRVGAWSNLIAIVSMNVKDMQYYIYDTIHNVQLPGSSLYGVTLYGGGPARSLRTYSGIGVVTGSTAFSNNITFNYDQLCQYNAYVQSLTANTASDWKIISALISVDIAGDVSQRFNLFIPGSGGVSNGILDFSMVISDTDLYNKDIIVGLSVDISTNSYIAVEYTYDLSDTLVQTALENQTLVGLQNGMLDAPHTSSSLNTYNTAISAENNISTLDILNGIVPVATFTLFNSSIIIVPVYIWDIPLNAIKHTKTFGTTVTTDCLYANTSTTAIIDSGVTVTFAVNAPYGASISFGLASDSVQVSLYSDYAGVLSTRTTLNVCKSTVDTLSNNVSFSQYRGNIKLSTLDDLTYRTDTLTRTASTVTFNIVDDNSIILASQLLGNVYDEASYIVDNLMLANGTTSVGSIGLHITCTQSQFANSVSLTAPISISPDTYQYVVTLNSTILSTTILSANNHGLDNVAGTYLTAVLADLNNYRVVADRVATYNISNAQMLWNVTYLANNLSVYHTPDYIWNDAKIAADNSGSSPTTWTKVNLLSYADLTSGTIYFGRSVDVFTNSYAIDVDGITLSDANKNNYPFSISTTTLSLNESVSYFASARPQVELQATSTEIQLAGSAYYVATYSGNDVVPVLAYKSSYFADIHFANTLRPFLDTSYLNNIALSFVTPSIETYMSYRNPLNIKSNVSFAIPSNNVTLKLYYGSTLSNRVLVNTYYNGSIRNLLSSNTSYISTSINNVTQQYTVSIAQSKHPMDPTNTPVTLAAEFASSSRLGLEFGPAVVRNLIFTGLCDNYNASDSIVYVGASTQKVSVITSSVNINSSNAMVIRVRQYIDDDYLTISDGAFPTSTLAINRSLTIHATASKYYDIIIPQVQWADTASTYTDLISNLTVPVEPTWVSDSSFLPVMLDLTFKANSISGLGKIISMMSVSDATPYKVTSIYNDDFMVFTNPMKMPVVRIAANGSIIYRQSVTSASLVTFDTYAATSDVLWSSPTATFLTDGVMLA